MRDLLLSITTLLIIFLTSCGPGQNNSSESSEQTVQEETAPTVSRVFFESPADGATVNTTFPVRMGVEGMRIEPAGQVKEGFGHHHILINQTSWPEGEIIPPSDSTIHFGKGQTETELTLEPGNYVISLQFADGVHTSYGASMATSIKIIVE
ncbi:MAG: DUF4399 domain-containing protein [Bacteroidetes bacterium]|nr:DUF4399 domain-containing protein [Bacteroidota bacterium]MDA1119253.1 DUF4399 domain-containing protein [Bacteroidota bacterium]